MLVVMKSFVSLIALASTVSAVALPAINAEGIPTNVPANLTALYPPYNFHSKWEDDYIPEKKSVFICFFLWILYSWIPSKQNGVGL